MIVVGYQGIGKSTIAGRDHRFIDLESSIFWIDGKRADDWYKAYCRIAEHLSKQGYIVFISSHKIVREYLMNNITDFIVLVYPSIELKDSWIEKLECRYSNSHLDKDYRSLMNAKERYEENIRELEECKCSYKIELTRADYDLESVLIHIRNTIK